MLTSNLHFFDHIKGLLHIGNINIHSFVRQTQLIQDLHGLRFAVVAGGVNQRLKCFGRRHGDDDDDDEEEEEAPMETSRESARSNQRKSDGEQTSRKREK